ncbi:MAG: hypothetical protein JSR64_07020 [Nitrospira sp.]|nr:hypothetical protein [Nitrospira sp.]
MTTHGLMDESQLRRVDGGHDNENETISWVEYYIGDEMVHRSAHVVLKKGIGMENIFGPQG